MKRFSKAILKVLVVGMSLYIIFSSVIPYTKDKVDTKEQEHYIIRQIEREIDTRATIDIGKELLKTKLENANLMVKHINNDIEYILKTVEGDYTISHNKSPNEDWNDWLIDSSIKLNLKYKAIISIPANKITTAIDKSGAVLIDYDISDIQVKSVEIIQYTPIFDKKILGKKYTNEEVISLIEIAQDNIRNNISNSDLIHEASINLDNHMKKLAIDFKVVSVGFNNKYIENTTKYEYIDNGNVKYGHPNRLMQDDVKYIVIHSTANPNLDAEAHRQYLETNRDAMAAHIYVDYDSAQETIDLDMVGWHSGDKLANESSIGIELCEFDDIDKQMQTIDNAKDILEVLQVKFPNAEVVYHKDISGKNCPSLVYGENPLFNENELLNILKNNK